MTLVLFLAIVAVAAASGAWFKPDLWFRGLRKPAWNPPDWAFGVVWPILYVAIAVAGWLVWEESAGQWTPAMTFWTLQIVLNSAWTWLYFGRHHQGLALADSLAMLGAIVGFIATSYAQSPLAALLFVPYAVWVAFACILNATILRLNPAPNGTAEMR